MKLAHGILAMLVTPFHDDYRLNEDALRREVQWAIAAGAVRTAASARAAEMRPRGLRLSMVFPPAEPRKKNVTRPQRVALGAASS